MAISIEATIAIVTLLIMCVPGGLWIVYRMDWLRPRPQRETDEEIALIYQRQPISNNRSLTPTWPVMVDAPFDRLFEMNGQLPVAMISLERHDSIMFYSSNPRAWAGALENQY